MARRNTKTRKTYKKAAYNSRSGRGYSNSRARASRARAAKRRRSTGGSRTVKIVIEQAPATGLSPMQERLLQENRVVLPRRARF